MGAGDCQVVPTVSAILRLFNLSFNGKLKYVTTHTHGAWDVKIGLLPRDADLYLRDLRISLNWRSLAIAHNQS